jgi:RNase P subunit RPR2
MVLITCKKCGDISYLTSEGLGNLTDFGFKCRNCDTINRISLADGETQKARIVRKPTDECGNYSKERT